MCEKAVEIQEIWKPNIMGGDYVCDEPHTTLRWTITDDRRIDRQPWVKCSHDVWLPRQDQLQEMLEFPTGSFKYNFWDALADLYEWSFSANWEKFKDYIPLSMEQLWLAFVMKEKYNKVWNGEEWIKGGI